MEDAEVLRRIITILDRFTTRVENNVRYGNYPFITHHNGNIRLFHFEDVDESTMSLTGWLIPVGIPFMMKYQNDDRRRDEREVIIDRARVIGYYLGNAMYIHEAIFLKYLGDEKNKVLFSPIAEDFVHITPGGWSPEEQLNFSKYLWQLTTKAMTGDFRDIADINFEAILHIDADILNRDGWIVSRLTGRNVFFGITECPVEQYTLSVETGEKYIWYNKYLTILDVTGGNGVQTFGLLRYGTNYHPHVSGGGNLCRGNAVRRIQDKLNTGQITEFFIFMKDFLSHYCSDNPFFKLPVRAGTGGSGLVGPKHLKDKVYCSGP